ncbi:nitroreductase/quinone reductase family protein [Pseudonocardia acaciae]|uniref:nitroreductase/quinone reductase family protein n=1 Tax=Pseudonocardia acaciae TaxID=551276 RepID=UPI00048F1812|nr:nitroreductase/quinone reductase family protein [Pseudonocardia acaciae]
MSVPDDVHAFNRAIIDEFRANNGRVSHEMLRNARLVLLTTTGARTGQPRTTPVAYFDDGPGRIVLWASARAAPTHPAWYRNLVANPRVTLEFGTETAAGTASTAHGAERDRLLDALRSANPAMAAHQDQTEREIPLVVITQEGPA